MAKRERMVVRGDRLADTVEGIAQRGDASRVCILNEEKHLLDIPISVSDPAAPASALAAPVLAAIRAFGTLVNECTVEVERR